MMVPLGKLSSLLSCVPKRKINTFFIFKVCKTNLIPLKMNQASSSTHTQATVPGGWTLSKEAASNWTAWGSAYCASSTTWEHFWTLIKQPEVEEPHFIPIFSPNPLPTSRHSPTNQVHNSHLGLSTPKFLAEISHTGSYLIRLRFCTSRAQLSWNVKGQLIILLPTPPHTHNMGSCWKVFDGGPGALPSRSTRCPQTTCCPSAKASQGPHSL